jgi:hypothetical protein
MDWTNKVTFKLLSKRESLKSNPKNQRTHYLFLKYLRSRS